MKKAILFFVLALVLPAQAQLVTVGMTAQVTQISDYGNLFQGNITTGDLITGYYTYDLATPDSNPDPAIGDYYQTGSNTGIWLTLKGYNFQSDPTNLNCYIGVANNYYGQDSHDLISYNNLSIDGRAVEIRWWLNDPSATVLSNDSLPLSAPVLSQWTGYQGMIIGGTTEDSLGNFTISAQILEFHDIPEPASIFLISLGILAVRKKTRN